MRELQGRLVGGGCSGTCSLVKKICFVFNCLIALSVVFQINVAYAQRASLSGWVRDSLERTPLESARVVLRSQADSSQEQGRLTDAQGRFEFQRLRAGRYWLRVSSIGYRPYVLSITLPEGPITPLTIDLEPENLQIKGVEITAKTPPVSQQGDTVQFNADAFKTQPDATAEDLLRKMPGVSVEQGQVKTQGERVQRVLVDGQPFFGDNPASALKNLPAGTVDKIQVFDQQSDQARFTGFDDGNTVKTINIVLKPTYRQGTFGRIQAGAGTDDRYQAVAAWNRFNGPSRLSLLGQLNNINQQNFATEDLSGAFGSATVGEGPGRGRRWGQTGISANVGDFLLNEQGGISQTAAGGFNLTDSLGRYLHFTTGYLYSRSDNVQEQDRRRTTFTGGEVGQLLDENSRADRLNTNHRFHFRGELTPDSANQFLFTPKLTLQDVDNRQRLTSSTQTPAGLLLNESNQQSRDQRLAWDFSTELLWMHKFKRKGRTLSTKLDVRASDRQAESELLAQNRFLRDSTARLDTLDQRGTGNQPAWRTDLEIAFTEPVGKHWQLDVRWIPSMRWEEARQTVNRFDPETGSWSQLDSSLSNTFSSRFHEQRVRVGWRLQSPKLMAFMRFDVQQVWLDAEQRFPAAPAFQRTFFAVTPGGFLRYAPNRRTNLRAWLRGSATPPRSSQLQALLDNSNPLQLSIGNPDLGQDYEARTGLRFNTTTDQYHSWSANANFRYTYRYVGTETWVADAGPLQVIGLQLERGQQLRRPVNLDGFLTADADVGWSRPLETLKMNLNLTLAVGFTRTPSRINEQINWSEVGRSTVGAALSSNAGPDLDYGLSWRGTFNTVQNSTRPELNDNFYTHTLEGRLTYTVWKGLYVQGVLTQVQFSGLATGIQPDIWLLNGAVGYRFLRNRAADVNVSVFDAFNQNTSVARSVTETWVDDTQTLVLRQYFLLNFTYRLLPRPMRKPAGEAPAQRQREGQ